MMLEFMVEANEALRYLIDVGYSEEIAKSIINNLTSHYKNKNEDI